MAALVAFEALSRTLGALDAVSVAGNGCDAEAAAKAAALARKLQRGVRLPTARVQGGAATAPVCGEWRLEAKTSLAAAWALARAYAAWVALAAPGEGATALQQALDGDPAVSDGHGEALGGDPAVSDGALARDAARWGAILASAPAPAPSSPRADLLDSLAAVALASSSSSSSPSFSAAKSKSRARRSRSPVPSPPRPPAEAESGVRDPALAAVLAAQPSPAPPAEDPAGTKKRRRAAPVPVRDCAVCGAAPAIAQADAPAVCRGCNAGFWPSAVPGVQVRWCCHCHRLHTDQFLDWVHDGPKQCKKHWVSNKRRSQAGSALVQRLRDVGGHWELGPSP